jgi:5-formyltetrahydrofolate cyclo-ligase
MAESNKTILRLEARRHRARMDIRTEDPLDAADHFFNTIKPEPGQVVAAYWPHNREFDSQPIIEKLLEDGIAVCLPVTHLNGSKELLFAQWRDDMELKKGDHGVLEPVHDKNVNWLEPDIVIVPLLAFDRRGYRLGQGGGHYDVTLAALRKKKKIVAVGLAYSQQACLFNLPVEEHDQKLDFVVTPQGTHSFNP